MNVQTIELAGQRFVILPETDFLELERQLHTQAPPAQTSPHEEPRFESVTPFDLRGESASDMLIRERR